MDTDDSSRQIAHIAIFTDLDGTLLSETSYEPGPSLPVLIRCRKYHIPVIFCSSKTADEITYTRKTLGNTDPFIVENGGAIYIPKGNLPVTDVTVRHTENFYVIEIGTPVASLRKALKSAAKKAGAKVRGMGEMSVDEVCKLTGLGRPQAKMAMERQFDEPFILDSGNPERLAREIRQLGYSITRGGRFFHILRGSDKGKAVKILIDLYRTHLPGLLTIGIGDAENDIPLLRAVDRAFLVKKPSGKWETFPSLPNLTKVDWIGPQGWAKAVSHLLDEAGYESQPRPKKL